MGLVFKLTSETEAHAPKEGDTFTVSPAVGQSIFTLVENIADFLNTKNRHLRGMLRM